MTAIQCTKVSCDICNEDIITTTEDIDKKFATILVLNRATYTTQHKHVCCKCAKNVKEWLEKNDR